MKRIAIISGTRLELIKMSPVIRECEKQSLDYFIPHTGQHYSYNMGRAFFEQLGLPEAVYNLDVGSRKHGGQTTGMLAGIEKILIEEAPGIVLVEGGTNTVHTRARDRDNPFGDGRAGARIVEILKGDMT